MEKLVLETLTFEQMEETQGGRKSALNCAGGIFFAIAGGMTADPLMVIAGGLLCASDC